MVDPLVSVITPTYNHERYIAECIESVLQQTFTDWEQIVVDDGSSDRTADIVEGYRDPRIRYIRLPHRGLASLEETYNTALQTATGGLVAVLEGDDRWPANKLELQVPVFEDPAIFLSWGRAELIDGDGNPIREFASLSSPRERVCLSARDLFARLVRINVLTPTASVVVRRSTLDRVGGFRQTGSSLYVDLPTWLSATLAERGRACFLNHVLAHYRVHQTQTTQRHRSTMEDDHLRTVLAVVADAAPEALRAAGWDEGMKAGALVAGTLASGLGCLASGDFHLARPLFARALRDARTGGDLAKAALGLLSTAIHLDLLQRAYSLRSRIRSARRSP
jgi:hypothetical protein